MYRLERNEFLKFPIIGLWALLGFQAGFINAFGFLACSRYVSHVTGFGTQIGVSLAESQVWTAFELFVFPASFIAGAFLNGVLTSARVERGLRLHYEIVTLERNAQPAGTIHKQLPAPARAENFWGFWELSL